MAFVVTAVTAEVVTVASVASAVAELGMTLSVVGAVTGSKDLMKVGGFMSLAGGVTSLASGAFGAAEGAASDAAAGAADGGLDLAGQQVAEATYTGANPAPVFSDAADAASSGMNGVSGLADTASDVTQQALSGTNFDSLGADSGAATAGNTGADTSVNAGSDISGISGPSSPTGASSPDTPTMKYGDNSITPGAPNVPQAIGGTVAPPGGTDPFSLQKWWASQPDSTKNLIMQGGLKAVGGLFQGWTEDQKLALERNKFALQQQMLSNGSAQPSINFQSKPTGIINSARSA
jgi:hypothetical protein